MIQGATGQVAGISTQESAVEETDEQLMAEFEEEALPHRNDLYRTAIRLLQDQGKASDAV